MPKINSIPFLSEIELNREEWRPVVGFESDYSVSDLGRVRRDTPVVNCPKSQREFPRLLTPTVQSGRNKYRVLSPYLRVSLSGRGRRSPYVKPLHRLVAEAFLGPLPKGCDTSHKNNNKHDCRLSNLEYLTKAEHGKHSAQTNQMPKGEANAHSAYTEGQVLQLRHEFEKRRHLFPVTKDLVRALCAELDIGISAAYHILNRRVWKHL